MKKRLSQWFTANKAIFLNTGSLIGSWGVTSGLGFVYWWLAAREFSPQDVGIASASISAMTLIGTFCLMGLGTLLITELPRQPEHTGSLISTALIVVCLVGGCVGFLFVLVAPSISANFSPLRATISTLLLFAFGVSLTSITLVLDQALIGLLKGGIQLWRNGLFALGKLVILFLVSRLLAGMGGIGIYATWAVGNLISLIPLAAIVVFKKQT
ncbi:MAG TPA: oligosaccharide flippase family protein, partial [Ktedonobacteraceae bacterium]|nr:oligosaccharide flippase family protein [Ktedonobacteraceae bacterium]